MRKRLGEVAAQNQLDIAIQQEGLGRRAKRLVVLDVDSTLIQDEVIELLGAEAGCESRIKEITDQRCWARSTSNRPFASVLDGPRDSMRTPSAGPGRPCASRRAQERSSERSSCWATAWGSSLVVSPTSPTGSRPSSTWI